MVRTAAKHAHEMHENLADGQSRALFPVSYISIAYYLCE